jgi:hypothetical protein
VPRAISLRKGGGLVDAPGRGLVGAKGNYPHCPVYLHDIEAYRSCNPVGFTPLTGGNTAA